MLRPQLEPERRSEIRRPNAERSRRSSWKSHYAPDAQTAMPGSGTASAE